MNALMDYFGEFWEILTGVVNDNKAKFIRLSCFTVLFLGILWAGANYFRADRIANVDSSFSEIPTPPPDTGRKTELEKFETLANTVANMRQGGEAIAETIAAVNSRPFNIEGYNEMGLESLGSDRDITRIDAIAAMAGNPEFTQQEVNAPIILVKAIMTSGKSGKAVVDAGDVKGLVVRRGDKLPGELGQVVRIKSNGITVRANKHDFDYEVSKIEVIKGMR